MAGIGLALDTLCDPGPVVVPTPAYMPFLDVAQTTGRERVDLPLDPDDEHATLDLDRLDALLAAGARTVLLSQPHNPWGRVFTRAELEGLRDVVLRHGARVISDEIHAPLVLDGAEHVPYLSVEGTADHAVTVLAASKAFNTAGLKCAQVVAPGRDDARALSQVPLVRNCGLSPLGAVAARAAYTEGDAWLDALRRRLSDQRDLFEQLLAAELPAARGPGGRRPPTSPGSTPAPTATPTRRSGRCGSGTCGSTPARCSGRATRATCGSTSPPRPSGCARSCAGWRPPGRDRRLTGM